MPIVPDMANDIGNAGSIDVLPEVANDIGNALSVGIRQDWQTILGTLYQ